MTARTLVERSVAALTLAANLAVVYRLLSTARSRVTVTGADDGAPNDSFTVIVPVLNEVARLAPCLEGLLRQRATVQAILVADTGSTDRTCDLVRAYQARDARVRLLQAGPPPPGTNGKAWGIRAALAHAPETDWYVCVDADVRPAPSLLQRLAGACRGHAVPIASVALRQALAPDLLSWLLHPAMLTTIVYRTGLPGQIYDSPHRAFANGQVLVVHRSVLSSFTTALDRILRSNAEDIALARTLAGYGYRVAFFDALDDSSVAMYPSGPAVWSSWPRSLALLEARPPRCSATELAMLVASQGLWLPLLVAARWLPGLRLAAWLGLLVRLGTLIGMRRAYIRPRIWYWLSALADPVVVARLLWVARARQVVWRGRQLSLRGNR